MKHENYNVTLVDIDAFCLPELFLVYHAVNHTVGRREKCYFTMILYEPCAWIAACDGDVGAMFSFS